MNLYEKIIAAYPELTEANFSARGEISLSDDLDGSGAYIAKWEYSKPIPNGLKLGK
jgi:hypothetical protein